MNISINYGTKVIYVPQGDLTHLGGNLYQLDLNDFRVALKDMEDSEEGMPFDDTHRHNTIVSVAGVTLARVIEMINDYTVTFEDGQYAVNLVGANSNVADVTNINQVSIRSFNTAGLITVTSGSGVTEQDKLDIADRVWDEDITDHSEADSTGDTLAGAGAAGDPWGTVLPGGYGNNTAGKILGTNLNAKVGDIKDKTDLIPTDPATNSQINTRLASDAYVGPPSVTDIDTQLSFVHGAGGWGGDNGLTIEDIVAGVVDGLEPLQVDVTTIKNSVSVIEQIEKGKWEIVNGIMTLYGTNGTTVLARFKLYDVSNKLATAPTQIPVKRVPY